MRTALSTIKIARLLGVAVKSIQIWIDQGKLRAGRTPGGHRRVSAADLVEFLREQNLPIPKELTWSAIRVLVVDDEPAMTRVISRGIKDRRPEWEIITANDGFSAGQLAESFHPTVILVDLVMPGVDGYEVCRQIKRMPSTQDSIVFGITAHHSPKAEKKILECGATACMPKPIDLDVLVTEIEKALA